MTSELPVSQKLKSAHTMTFNEIPAPFFGQPITCLSRRVKGAITALSSISGYRLRVRRLCNSLLFPFFSIITLVITRMGELADHVEVAYFQMRWHLLNAICIPKQVWEYTLSANPKIRKTGINSIKGHLEGLRVHGTDAFVLWSWLLKG